MEKRIKQYNEYASAALAFSLLSIIGSFLSLINIITLMITYQLLQKAKIDGLSKRKEKVINSIFEASLLLTLCITVLYITIQL